MAAHVHDGHGVSLLDRWGDAPAAYLGTAVPEYPNLFLVLGPNIVPGRASVLPTVEAQGRFIADAVAAMGRPGWTSLEVRPEVAAKLDADVQRALEGTVWRGIGRRPPRPSPAAGLLGVVRGCRVFGELMVAAANGGDRRPRHLVNLSSASVTRWLGAGRSTGSS